MATLFYSVSKDDKIIKKLGIFDSLARAPLAMALSAAKDFYYKLNGGKQEWPLTFEIFDNKGLNCIGLFKIDQCLCPSFIITKLEDI